jgi:hypothetical protein
MRPCTYAQNIEKESSILTHSSFVLAEHFCHRTVSILSLSMLDLYLINPAGAFTCSQDVMSTFPLFTSDTSRPAYTPPGCKLMYQFCIPEGVCPPAGEEPMGQQQGSPASARQPSPQSQHTV